MVDGLDVFQANFQLFEIGVSIDGQGLSLGLRVAVED